MAGHNIVVGDHNGPLYLKIVQIANFAEKLQSEPARYAAQNVIDGILKQTGDWQVGNDGELLRTEDGKPVPVPASLAEKGQDDDTEMQG